MRSACRTSSLSALDAPGALPYGRGARVCTTSSAGRVDRTTPQALPRCAGARANHGNSGRSSRLLNKVERSVIPRNVRTNEHALLNRSCAVCPLGESELLTPSPDRLFQQPAKARRPDLANEAHRQPRRQGPARCSNSPPPSKFDASGSKSDHNRNHGTRRICDEKTSRMDDWSGTRGHCH